MSFDIAQLNQSEELSRRIFSASLAAIAEKNRNRMAVLALPYRVFDNHMSTQKYSGSDQNNWAVLKKVLGIGTRGYRADALVSLTSLQHAPLRTMEAFSGVAMGIHHLHKPPKIGDARRILEEESAHQTPEALAAIQKECITEVRQKLASFSAVITVTNGKKKHHAYPHYEAWWKDFLQTAGYKPDRIVTDISPEQHDQFMAQIQFLTHSMFLTAASLLRRFTHELDPANTPVAYGMQEIGKRMLTQSHETYEGIATENIHNATIFKQWEQAVRDLKADTPEALMRKLVLHTQRVARDFMESIQVSSKTQSVLTTPVSEVRDTLLTDLPDYDFVDSPNIGSIDLKSDFEKYRNAINNPGKGYGSFFEGLREAFPDFKNHQSDELVKKAKGLMGKTRAL